MNPIPDLLQQNKVRQIINQRLEKCSLILHKEKRLIKEWTFVQAVVNACWAEHDGNQDLMDYFITIATIIKIL